MSAHRIDVSKLSRVDMAQTLLSVASDLRSFETLDLLARKRIDRCLSQIGFALHQIEVEPQQVTCGLCGAIYEDQSSHDAAAKQATRAAPPLPHLPEEAG